MIRFLLNENKTKFFSFIFLIVTFFLSFGSYGQISAVTVIEPITSICPQKDVTIKLRISNDAIDEVLLNGLNLHLDVFDKNSNLYFSIDTVLTSGKIPAKSVKDITITKKATFLKLGIYTYKMVASLPSDTKSGYDNVDETIAVIGNELSLLSTESTSNQTVCLGNNITSIIYKGGGITDLISVSNLPNGLFSNYDPVANQLTISGKPSLVGDYNFNITASGTCPQHPDGIKKDSTLAARLLVRSLPVVSITGSNSICVNKTTKLSPTIDGTWTSSNPAIATVTSPGGIVTGISAGRVTFTFLSNTSGCSAKTEPVEVIGLPNVPELVGDAFVCKNSSIELKSTTPGGVWSSSSPAKASVILKSDNGINSIATVKGLQIGLPNPIISYTVTVNGCSTIKTKTITVFDIPTITKSFSKTGKDSVCVNHSINVDNATNDGTWSVKEPTIATITAELNQFPLLSGVKVGKTEIYYTKTDGQCINRDTLVMYVIAIPPTGNLSGVSTICQSDSTFFTSTVTGGTWTSSDPSIASIDKKSGKLIGISKGSVSVYYTVNNGICSNIDSLKIVVKPLPIVSQINGNNNLCIGTSVTFSNTNLNGVWSSSKTDVASVEKNTGIVTPLNKGLTTIKYLVIEDGCSVEKSIDVNVYEIPSVSNIVGQDKICIGDSIQYSNASLGGIWTVTDPSIFKVNDQGKVTALKKGTTSLNYEYSVNGCTAYASKSIIVNSLPVVSAGQDLVLCKGQTATLKASGANEYSWNNGLGSGEIKTFIPLDTKTYIVTGKDGNGCLNTDEVKITVNPLPLVSAGVDRSICKGDTVTIIATGAINYSWDNGLGIGGTKKINPLVTTTYTVTGTDNNGCSNTDAVKITVNLLPIVSAGDDVSICKGSTTTLTANGAITYSWNNALGVGSSKSVNPLLTTVYKVIGKDNNGCENTDSVIVTVNSLPLVSAGNDVSICKGDTTVLTATGANTYSWDKGLGLGGTKTINPLITTTYTVIGTDNNGCISSDMVKVIVNSIPLVSAGNDVSICKGGSTPIAGSGAITYDWDNGLGSGATKNVSPLVTTTYKVKGTDNNGCFNFDEVKVNVNSLPNISVGADTSICKGGTAKLLASGATTYLWDNGLGLGSAKTISPLSTTTYKVIGTDNNGCVNSDLVVVTVNLLPVVSVGKDTSICKGGSVILTASGATKYTWDNGLGLGETKTINPLITTTYTVTGTDNNGCTNTDALKVTVNSLPIVSAGNDISICKGVSRILTATGATTFSWDNGLGVGSTKTINPLATTTYIVTGTDNNGCSNTDEVKVTVNPLPAVFAGNDISICFGQTTTLTASGAITYSWDNGLGLGSTKTVSPQITKNYKVIGTDNNGCANSDEVTVNVNSLPIVSLGDDISICKGEDVILTASGATTYSWDNGLGTGEIKTISPLSTTTYTVIGTDNNGCKNTDILKVTVNSLPIVSAGNDISLCKGGSKVLTATGAKTYSWDNGLGLGNIKTVNPLVSTTYIVSGTDNNGCTNTDEVKVTVNSLPIVSAGNDIFICKGLSTILTATGANNYSWDNGLGSGETKKVSPLVTTTYIVTGTDINGCLNTDEVKVIIKDLPTVKAIATKDSICKGESVTLNGQGAIKYVWNNDVLNNTPFVPSQTGFYKVTGEGDNGCFQSDSIEIVVKIIPNVEVVGLSQIVCNNDLFTLKQFSGTLGATFDWVNNNSTIGLASKGSGDIPAFVGKESKNGLNNVSLVKVTPSLKGCIGTTKDFNLTVRPSDSPDFSYNSSSFCLSVESNPKPTITGKPNGTFSSNSSDIKILTDGTIDLKNSKTGVYLVTYTTNGICKSDSTIRISLLDNPTVNKISDTSICLNSSVIIPFSGKLGTEFEWKNSNINIGLPNSGKSDQLEFVASGTTVDGGIVSSTIIVTPKAGVCVGIPDTFEINVLPTENSNFIYDKTSYCKTKDGNPSVIVKGKPGGSFSILPNSNALDPLTGKINLSSIASGVYEVKYTTNGICKSNSTFTISVGENPFVNPISNQVVCKESSFQKIDFSGGVGNTFVWTNSNTLIGLPSSGVGSISSFIAKGDNITASITVTPSIGTCFGVPFKFDLTSNSKDNAAFNYNSNSFCDKDLNPLPQIIGTKGGLFSSIPVGLMIDVTTGSIDLSKTLNNKYTISYITKGTCGDTAKEDIYINSNPTVDNISDQLLRCQGEQIDGINFTGSVGSTFSWINQNPLIGLASNGQGSISPFILQNTTNSPISSKITVTPKAGSCVGVAKEFTLTVNPQDDPSFNYSKIEYCLNTPNILPTLNGTKNGSFSTDSPGFIINSLNGEIDFSKNSPGIYSVKYTTKGICPNDSTTNISILLPPTVSGKSDVCVNASLLLSKKDGENGIWQTLNGAVASVDAFGVVKGLKTGKASILYTSENGCSDTLNIKVNPIPLIEASSSMCLNGVQTAKGSEQENKDTPWISSNSNILTVDKVGNLFAKSVGVSTLSFMSSVGCISSKPIAVLDLPFIEGNQDVCTESVIKYLTSDGSNQTGLWLSLDNKIGTINTQGEFKGISKGSTKIQYTDLNGCKNQKIIVVNPLPIISGKTDLCLGSSSTLTSTGVPLNNEGWKIENSAIVQLNQSDNKATIKGLETGITKINFTDNKNCQNELSISVNTIPDVIASISSTDICSGSVPNIQLSSSYEGTLFSWTATNIDVVGGRDSANVEVGGFIKQPLSTVVGKEQGFVIYTVTPNLQGCQGTPIEVKVTVKKVENPSFKYSKEIYCSSENNPLPIITGSSGGLFTVLPLNGLNIDQKTGVINLSSSKAGIYEVRYVSSGVCAQDSKFNVEIKSTPSIESVEDMKLCQDQWSLPINFQGSQNTKFNWVNTNPAIGLSSTGEGAIPSFKGSGTVIGKNSIAGIVQVTPERDGCTGNKISFVISVNSKDNPSISYANYTYCYSDASIAPIINGSFGGKFSSSSANLVVDAETGVIDISSSKPGKYSITYTTNGSCPNDTTVQIAISDKPSVEKIDNQTVCEGSEFNSIFFKGAEGTTFTWENTNSAIGLASKGEGDILAFKGTGTKIGGVSSKAVIEVTPSAGSCVGEKQKFNLEVNPLQNANFTYPDNSFCKQRDLDPIAKVTGEQGGVFSISPLINSFNSSTGFIDVSTVESGEYTLTYTTSGLCKNSTSMKLFIGDNPSVNDINNQSVCKGASFNEIVFSGNPGTVFDWSNNNTSIGLKSFGTGTIPSFEGLGATEINPNNSALINVTPRIGSCKGVTKSFELLVKYKEPVKLSYDNISYCNKDKDPIPVIVGDKTGTFYAIQEGMTINTSTGIINLKTTKDGIYDVVYKTSGFCADSSIFKLHINSSPVVNSLSNQIVCAGISFNKIEFSGSLGAVFDWTNSSSSIGLNSFGSGNISSFISENNTPDLLIGKITVTPKAGSCEGIPTTFNLSVRPSDDATFDYGKSDFCYGNEVLTPSRNLISGVFSSEPFGLNIDQKTGVVNVLNSSPSTYTITYKTTGICPNISTKQLTILEKPVLTTISNQTKCAGDPFNPIDFQSSIPSTTFTWTNSNISIGLPSSGSGGISGFIGVSDKLGVNPVTSLIKVIPRVKECIGDEKSFLLTVNPNDNPGFKYSDNSFCFTENNPTPIVTGTKFGEFTSSSSDLVLDKLTGTIKLNQSKPGTYIVKYTTKGICPKDSSVTISVGETPTVDFVQNKEYCQGVNTSEIIFTGGLGTVFEWKNSNSALGIASSGTGTIPSFIASGPTVGGTFVTGNIVVTPRIGKCVGSPVTFVIKVNPLDDPGFSYSDISFCKTQPNPQPTVFGFQGGSFSAEPAGLSISSSTGMIFLNNSQDNTYTIKYQTKGVCPNSTTTTLSVGSNPTVNPVFDRSVCVGSNFESIVFTGKPGTNFEWVNSDPSIGLSANGKGNIPEFLALSAKSSKVVVTPLIGTCRGKSIMFTLNAIENNTPIISYSQPSYCLGDNNPLPSVLGGMNGIFSASPEGLFINSSTGEINLEQSGIGIYVITYNVSGTCSSNATAKVAIGSSPSIDDIPSQVVCNGTFVKSIVFKGSAGTQFTWKNNNSLIGLQENGEGNITSFIGQNSTKEKIVANITVNPYVGTCKGKAKSFVITVNPSDDPTFNFSSGFACKNSPINPFPMIEGTPGGIFSASPAGLFINSSTGEIDVKKSLLNSYNITYVTKGLCSKASTVTMKINPFPTMEDVSNQSVCSGSMFNVISFRGTKNTVYQWTNNQPSIGLSKTGTNDIESFKAKEITDLGQSLSANIIVTPELDGCYGDPKNFTLTVNKSDNPSFVYSHTSLCLGDKNLIPFVKGTKNGTFSSSVGLSLNSNTGEIIIDKSIPGNYAVKYTTSGLCPKDSIVSIIINSKPTVNSIVSQQKCYGSNFDPINFVGNATNYKWTNSQPSIGLISSGNGNIPSFVASGTIRGGNSISSVVTVIPELNGCKGDPQVFSLIVNSKDDPSFNFLDNSFCITEQNPIPIVKGTLGGIFTSKPEGLKIDSKTGKVDILKSSFGLYDVTYTTTGKCKSDSTVKIGIGENPSINPPDFDNIRCEGDIFKTVKFSGNPGTVFEWTNNNISIGIPAKGIGDMPSFVARGTVIGGVDTTATISVTPRIGICIGKTVTFKYKIKAKPIVEAGIYDFFSNSSSNKDTVYCKGGKATLVASGSSKVEDYYWFPNNTLSSSTGARVFASTDITQEYVVVGRNEYCVNSDTVKLTVINPIINPITDTSVCAGTNFNAIKFTGNQYSKLFDWTNSNTKIGLLNKGIDSIISFKGLISANVSSEIGIISVTPKYIIQETGEECKGTPTTFKLTVNKQESASFTGYQTEYCGSESIVTPPKITGTKGGVFSVNNKNLAINSSTGQIFPSASKAGEYSVIYSTLGICSKVDSTKIIIRPQLQASISGGDTVCEGDLNAKIVFKGKNGIPPYVFKYKINDAVQESITTDYGVDSVVLSVPKLKSGSYNFVVEQIQESSSFNCISNVNASTTLVIKPLPIASIYGSTVVCIGSEEPEVTITGLNGTSPFTFTYAINAVKQPQISSIEGENFVKIKVPTNLKGLNTFSLIEVRDNGLLGCTQSLRQIPTVVVNVKDAPNATVSISPKSVCLGSNAEVQFTGANGNSPYEFTFKINGGPSQVVKSSIGNDKISIPITTSKVDTLIYEVIKVQDASTSTCKNEANKSIDTIIIVPGAFVKQVSDLPVCEGKNSDSIVFAGSNGTEFNWVNDNITIGLPALGKNSIPSFIGKNAPNSATITVTPTTGACMGEPMKFRINVRPKPTPKVLGADNSICSGDSVKLVGLTPEGVFPRYTYYWSPDNTLSCFQCDTNYAKPTKTTNYKVTANDGRGCDFMLVVPIVVRNKPNVYGFDTTICGDPSFIKLKGYGAKTYTWSDGIKNNISFMPTKGVKTYLVEGTDEFGCKNIDSVSVSVLTPPTAEMSADKLTGFAPLTVNFTNNSKNAVKYEWDFRNSSVITTNKTTSQSSTFSKYGDYLVTLKAFNGSCVNVKELVVIVKKLDTLSIVTVPNIFSPNNDGKNDVFSITVNNAKTLRLQIFNRWGNIVHELTETTPYWDGKINGYDAGEGVYFYIFDVEDEAGQKQKGEGFIQLIRD